MKMTFRWYGEGNDRIKLSDIKQIPGVEGIVWALHDKMPGEIWSEEEIAKVKAQCDEYGFNIDVVESVNVHDDIKIGLPTRDKYIENYKQTIRNLSKFGVKVICYNFMPIFDWTRSNLFHEVGDGSTALFYEKGMIQDDYNAMAKYILDFTEKYNMSFPGWEPERMAKLDELFKAYEGVTKEKLWENLKYHALLDQSTDKIVETAKRTGAKVSGPIPLPTKKEVVTILRAVHKYKDSREQFELRTHKRLIDVLAPNAKTIDALKHLDLPAGVDIELKI